MTASPILRRRERALGRIARALCPRSHRTWVDAMLAELAAVEPDRRTAWLLGAGGIVLSGVRARVAAIPHAIGWGLALALCALAASAIAVRTETEMLIFDDDVFTWSALLSIGMLVGFGVLAINWIFNHVEAAPRSP